MQAAFANTATNLVLLITHLWVIYSRPRLVHRYFKRTKNLPFFLTPNTINEKFLWRKLFDHNPVFTEISDKLACKEYVHKQVQDISIAKVLKIIEHPDEILELTDAFLKQPWVLKSSHSSGDVLVMPNGCLDKAMLALRAKTMLEKQHGKSHYEWGYFNVPKKVFFEEYIETTDELSEFKIYTFGDQIGRVIQIGGRFKKLWAQAWDLNTDGSLIPSTEPAVLAPPKAREQLPETIEQILNIAIQLGRPFDHMRVDILSDGRQIWFGELTVYNQAGYHLAQSGFDPHSSLTKMWNLLRSYYLCEKTTNISTLENIYKSALKRRLQTDIHRNRT